MLLPILHALPIISGINSIIFNFATEAVLTVAFHILKQVCIVTIERAKGQGGDIRL